MKGNVFVRLLILISPVIILSMSSCQVLFPSIMLKVAKNDTTVQVPLMDSAAFSTEYRLAANDIIEFRLFANDGFKMIDLITSGSGVQNNAMIRQGFEYTLDARGEVKLPIIGMVKLDSMTLREAEAHLEERYAVYYVKPFAMLRVVNRRVTIYPGEPGAAKVIPLVNNNTTVLEAIGLAGGISANGKAHKIYLIRQTENPAKPDIYRLDLSKMENIAQGNIVVQSNDIIYVEPRKRYAARTLQEISPILSLISAGFTLFLLFRGI